MLRTNWAARAAAYTRQCSHENVSWAAAASTNTASMAAANACFALEEEAISKRVAALRIDPPAPAPKRTSVHSCRRTLGVRSYRNGTHRAGVWPYGAVAAEPAKLSAQRSGTLKPPRGERPVCLDVCSPRPSEHGLSNRRLVRTDGRAMLTGSVVAAWRVRCCAEPQRSWKRDMARYAQRPPSDLVQRLSALLPDMLGTMPANQYCTWRYSACETMREHAARPSRPDSPKLVPFNIAIALRRGLLVGAGDDGRRGGRLIQRG